MLIELDCIVGLHVFQDLVQHVDTDWCSIVFDGRSDLGYRRLLCGRLAQYRDDLIPHHLVGPSVGMSVGRSVVMSVGRSVGRSVGCFVERVER